MILAILLSAILAGLDNLQVGAALGVLPIPRRRLAHYAIAFTFAETLAPLLGMACSSWLFASVFRDFQAFGPAVLIGCGATLLILLWRRRDPGVVVDRPGMVAALALSLSYDNFLLGIGLGAAGVAMLPAVVATGVICGLLSCLGLFGASALRRFLPRGAGAAIASVALCALGLHALVAG